MPDAMNKKDYIESISSKLSDKKIKTALEREFSDHIQTKEEYWQEVGYSSEQSELKAVEAMGEAEPVAEQIKKVHNENHFGIVNFFLYIIFTLASFFSYLISIDTSDVTYADNNYKTIYLFMVSALSCCMLCACASISIKKKSNAVAIINLISAALNLYMAVEVSVICVIIAAAAAIFVIISTAFTIQYNKKIALFKNKKKDLQQKNIFLKLSAAIAVILLILSVLLFSILVSESYKYGEKYKNEILPYIFELAEDEEALEKNAVKESYPDAYFYNEYESGTYDCYIDSICADIKYHKAEKDYYIHAYASSYYVDFFYAFIYNSIPASAKIIKSPDTACDEKIFSDKSKQEILKYFTEHNPCDVSIYITETKTRYDFGYRRNKNLSYERIVWVTFNSDGTLQKIEYN